VRLPHEDRVGEKQVKTADEFIAYAINREKTERRINLFHEVLDAIRSMEREEAASLLGFYGAVCDRDCGYGSWSATKDILDQED